MLSWKMGKIHAFFVKFIAPFVLASKRKKGYHAFVISYIVYCAVLGGWGCNGGEQHPFRSQLCYLTMKGWSPLTFQIQRSSSLWERLNHLLFVYFDYCKIWSIRHDIWIKAPLNLNQPTNLPIYRMTRAALRWAWLVLGWVCLWTVYHLGM